ncbi:(2Fe-2S)-binding protein [Blastococcus sp. CT_GayMR19]|uniref:Rieske 2Fe-2S domain-containing protein n=1 Tax=Blastococcus sp. CT_GayMR19 TaxID=2559608 RepID=UPI0010748E76|nr:Rieske 2Fe-2S domain-containing protein [Blastococcus sp. CT_GayMR19]TFV74999.1 (2Fe-2S)-binding protein [Blastococcus sp. CT_GayMR19]
MAVSHRRSTGWYPVARAAEVGTTPVPVGAGGRAYVVVRLRPGAEVTAFPARCPHRLVPLAAGSVVDGRLQCGYHGWRFDAEGRCVGIPSLGDAGTPPPRADLSVPWAVEERHGWVWLAPERTAAPAPPRPSADTVPEPVPAAPAPAGPVFGNLDPSLDHAWHPVALSRELRPGGWLQVRLLGRTWTLRRTADGVEGDPPAFGVRERFGIVWLAPAEPIDVPLDLPEATDRHYVPGWLPPLRSPGPAGPMADNFLDVAHFAHVHGATFGAEDRPEVPVYDVVPEPGGFRSTHEQWCENPTDPEVARGGRPLRQRRRAGYVYRAPFSFRVSLEYLDSGATTTILFLLQPEDADSTRIYTCLFLSAGHGQPLPLPAAVAEEVAFHRRVLEEDLRLMGVIASEGLPLDVREELHVPADRLGVALRRALCDFATARRARTAS